MQMQKQGRLPLNYSEESEKGEKKEGEKDGTFDALRTMKPDAEKDDPRSMPTKINLAKNKLRAMGLKMSYDMEGEMTEATEDSLRDRRMERGGVDGNTRYDRAPKAPNTKKFGTGKTMAQKEMEKKYGKGASAMDVVKAQIRAKHGKGAIMDTKKK